MQMNINVMFYVLFITTIITGVICTIYCIYKNNFRISATYLTLTLALLLPLLMIFLKPISNGLAFNYRMYGVPMLGNNGKVIGMADAIDTIPTWWGILKMFLVFWGLPVSLLCMKIINKILKPDNKLVLIANYALYILILFTFVLGLRVYASNYENEMQQQYLDSLPSGIIDFRDKRIQ